MVNHGAYAAGRGVLIARITKTKRTGCYSYRKRRRRMEVIVTVRKDEVEPKLVETKTK